MNPLDHIEESDLRELFGQITTNPYAVLQASIGKIKDRLAVAQAKREAVRGILEDFGEHGEANRALFGGHRRPYFEKLARALDAEIAERHRRGERSDLFDRYRKRREEMMDRAAQEFVDDMAAEETQARRTANDMVRANHSPPLILEALEKLAKLPYVGPPSSDTVEGVVHNALRECAIHDDWVSGGRIVLAFAKASPSLKRGPHYETLVGSAAIVARDSESRRALWEVLVPEAPTESRLAYNLACNAAVAGDKERLLRYARIALALGKKKDQFMGDSDFAAVLKDGEFLAVLEQPGLAKEE
jgi:hypothetical protein